MKRMAKRVTLNRMDAYDMQYETCNVRLIEMTVDSLINDPGYSIQFWRDVELYGLQEAFTMMRYSEYVRVGADLTKLQETIDRVIRRMART